MDRRDALKLGASAIAATVAPNVAVASDEQSKYEGVCYQGWTPTEPHNHLTFVQRFESRAHKERGEHTIVGVSLHGGPVHFISDKEADQHVQAIWDAALVEGDNVRKRHADNAEKSIALHQQLSLAHDPHLIRAHHQLIAEKQVATYHGHVRQMMDERKAMKGPSHPTLAIELHRRVIAERATQA